MRIGILTLKLHTNYGGILQAYALQRTLQEMGHSVCIIDNEVTRSNPAITFVAYIYRCFMRYIIGNRGFVTSRGKRYRAEQRVIRERIEPFFDRYLNLLKCQNFNISPSSLDAIVVGSDQVWRPKGVIREGIESMYLKFTEGWEIKRIAYAASFGTDVWEYSPKQSAHCRELIRHFDAISVRERSAVKLCRDNFGVDAKHLIDPTLLLDKDDYIELAKGEAESCGDLFVYILDSTPDKSALIESIKSEMSLTPFYVNSRAEDQSAPINERIHPPIEAWIRGFIDAKYIVTDSFHATVFSIIFNKPFVVYGNNARGATRFESLLSQFNLTDRYISSSSELNIASLKDISWQEVNESISELKSQSIEYLLTILARKN